MMMMVAGHRYRSPLGLLAQRRCVAVRNCLSRENEKLKKIKKKVFECCSKGLLTNYARFRVLEILGFYIETIYLWILSHQQLIDKCLSYSSIQFCD